MKNLIKNNALALLFMGLLATQVSCSSSDRKEAGNESETAYNDFKNYVTNVENSTASASDSMEADWETASANARSEYDAKVAAMDQYSTEYDESRRQEIDQLKSRYNAYWESRNLQHQAQLNATGTNMSGGLAATYDASAAAAMEPMKVRLAYENFVEYVRTNRDSFSKADWQAAENYFNALDNRKNAVQSQLSDKDKYEIGKAKAKYTALRAGRLGIDASEAATTVSDDAQEVGSEVKDATKTGAQKVGNTAEKVGSQIKSTVKSGAQKIDQKIDDNPNVD